MDETGEVVVDITSAGAVEVAMDSIATGQEGTVTAQACSEKISHHHKNKLVTLEVRFHSKKPQGYFQSFLSVLLSCETTRRSAIFICNPQL